MRIDLAGERLQPGFHEQLVLLLDLRLVAGIVPDFERQRDGEKSSDVVGHITKIVAGPLGVRQENHMWEEVPKHPAEKLGKKHRQSKSQREHLEILQRPPEIEIRKGRKPPYVFRILNKIAQETAHHANRCEEW